MYHIVSKFFHTYIHKMKKSQAVICCFSLRTANKSINQHLEATNSQESPDLKFTCSEVNLSNIWYRATNILGTSYHLRIFLFKSPTYIYIHIILYIILYVILYNSIYNSICNYIYIIIQLYRYMYSKCTLNSLYLR